MYIKFKGQIKVEDNRNIIFEGDVVDHLYDAIIYSNSDREVISTMNLEWEIVEEYDSSN